MDLKLGVTVIKPSPKKQWFWKNFGLWPSLAMFLTLISLICIWGKLALISVLLSLVLVICWLFIPFGNFFIKLFNLIITVVLLVGILIIF